MTTGKRCTIQESMNATIRTVSLENALLKVTILVGKGADIFEMIYKPTNIDVLLKTDNGLDVFENRNLAEQRLVNYSELFTGGWQDCLPHRARYLELDITQFTGGIAATVPWSYKIDQHTDEVASICCFVELPDIPFYVEKKYIIKQGEARLYVEQRIRNVGEAPVQFTWTQHAAFGEQFLDEQVSIEFPECVAFHARQYDSAYKHGLSHYEEPIDRITLPDGKQRNIRQVLSKKTEEELFIVLKNVSEPRVKLINPNKSMGIQLCWELDAFPYIRYWSNSIGSMYTVAIEPSNDAFANFDHSLEHGTYRELQPGEEYATVYDCEIFVLT